jgi:uncharacterized membrane protein YbhN (UPF0104 family)
MDVFGISMQELIFSIFLPFVLFYVLFYALLRKSKILGENKSLDAVTALVFSAIVITSMYSLGITQYLANFSAAVAVACFAALFIYGTIRMTLTKGWEYATEGDRKRFEELKKKGQELLEKLPKDPSLLPALDNIAKELETLAKKLKKDLSDVEWYSKYKEYKKSLEKGG